MWWIAITHSTVLPSQTPFNLFLQLRETHSINYRKHDIELKRKVNCLKESLAHENIPIVKEIVCVFLFYHQVKTFPSLPSISANGPEKMDLGSRVDYYGAHEQSSISLWAYLYITISLWAYSQTLLSHCPLSLIL